MTSRFEGNFKRSADRTGNRNGFTLVELLLVIAGLALLVAFLLPAHRSSPRAARRTQCKNNLKQIGLALHNYHDHYGSFPPAYTVDAEGRRLHSWRTLILPFMDSKPLYDSIDLSKPWDDPANAVARDKPMPFFACPSASNPQVKTNYAAIVCPGSAMQPDCRKIADFKDGLENTLMVVEVDAEHSFHWMSPQDVDEEFILSIGPKSSLSHNGGFQSLAADGAVHFISAETPAEVRRKMISVAGKDWRGISHFAD